MISAQLLLDTVISRSRYSDDYQNSSKSASLSESSSEWWCDSSDESSYCNGVHLCDSCGCCPGCCCCSIPDYACDSFWSPCNVEQEIDSDLDMSYDYCKEDRIPSSANPKWCSKSALKNPKRKPSRRKSKKFWNRIRDHKPDRKARIKKNNYLSGWY